MIERARKQKMKQSKDKSMEVEYLKYKYYTALENYYREKPIDIISYKDFKKK